MTKQCWWEDYNVGDRYVSEPYLLHEDEIKAFAKQFDPQPFHLDPEAAAQTIYGGLIASGWHLASLCFRLFVDTGFFGDGHVSLGSPGVEDLRWRRPARPGDRLTMTATILDKFPHKSKSEIGFVRCQFELGNQNAELVLQLASNLMLRRQHTTEGLDGHDRT
jgi:acyl dehydratase